MKGRMIAVAAAVLVALAVQAGAQYEMRTSDGMARSEALQKLVDRIREVRLADGKTLGDALDTAKEDIPVKALIEGVEQLAPVRYHDTGECEVKVRIQQKQLRANIENLLKQYALETKGLAPESLQKPEEYVEADARVPELQTSETARDTASAVPPDLEGWTGIDALDRNKTEHAALTAARERVVAQLTTLLGDAPKADEIKAKLPAIVDGILPQSRCFLAGGIVEMTVSAPTADVMTAIRSDNEKLAADKKLDEAQLSDIAKRLGSEQVRATACKTASGAPCDEKELNKYVALKPDELFGTLPKPQAKEETKPAATPVTGEPTDGPAKSEK